MISYGLLFVIQVLLYTPERTLHYYYLNKLRKHVFIESTNYYVSGVVHTMYVPAAVCIFSATSKPGIHGRQNDTRHSIY
jgi:hypothetical protein